MRITGSTRVPASFVATCGAIAVLFAAGLMSVLGASQPGSSGCYSLLVLDGISGSKSPVEALAAAQKWAEVFAASPGAAHPQEGERMAAVASAANKALATASDEASAVYESRTAGQLDGRFEIVASEDGWHVETITVKAPAEFCTTED